MPLLKSRTFVLMEENVFSFKTIKSGGIGEFRDRGSKFYGFSFHVKDEKDVKQALNKIKEEHAKANHHCYAWRLGLRQLNFRIHDDGEPSGSAGRPILGRIDSAGLTDVLVVVVRYFGGTLLGIPGLINAYKTAAQASLQESVIEEQAVCASIQLNFDYTLLNDVMRLVKQYNIEVRYQKMELFCLYELEVPLKIKDEFLQKAKNIYGLEIEAL